MAMIVGGMAAVAQIGSAVAGTIVLVKKINNEHAQQMVVLSNQHEQKMAELNKQQTGENNRHKEFMGLLALLYESVNILGNEIFGAEYDGCKGLPGKKVIKHDSYIEVFL